MKLDTDNADLEDVVRQHTQGNQALAKIYARLGRAYANQTGCRLSPADVDTLLQLDHGVAMGVLVVLDVPSLSEITPTRKPTGP